MLLNHRMDGRVVVWFSCGAASACASYIAVKKYRNVKVVYCNTSENEHPDNKRFLKDVENWIQHPIEKIGSQSFTTVEEVFDDRNYMSGPKGAPCTLELKKKPRYDFELPNDLHIFGLTADELGRIDRFESNNSHLELEWNLRDAGITKEDCLFSITDEGIELPALYKLGFKNNNCLGCVKATSPKYWDKVRIHFPEVFERRAKQSRRIGCRLVRYQGERIFLDQLPIINNDPTPEEDIDCGPVCVKGSN